MTGIHTFQVLFLQSCAFLRTHRGPGYGHGSAEHLCALSEPLCGARPTVSQHPVPGLTAVISTCDRSALASSHSRVDDSLLSITATRFQSPWCSSAPPGPRLQSRWLWRSGDLPAQDTVSQRHSEEELGPKAEAAAESLQSCPTLGEPIEGSHQAPRPWGSPRQTTKFPYVPTLLWV